LIRGVLRGKFTVNKVLRKAVHTADSADYTDCDDFKDEIVAWCVVLQSEAREALRIVSGRYASLYNAYSRPRTAIEARRRLQEKLAAWEDKA
jgi:hypothetical protein